MSDAAFERFAPDWTDEPSSDDEEMKRAFFSELEKKHGGPISAEELRLWSNALDEDDTDVEIAPVVEAAYSSAASARASREGSTRASLDFVDALSSPEGSTRASRDAGGGEDLEAMSVAELRALLQRQKAEAPPPPSAPPPQKTPAAAPAHGWLTPADGGAGRRRADAEDLDSVLTETVTEEAGPRFATREVASGVAPPLFESPEPAGGASIDETVASLTPSRFAQALDTYDHSETADPPEAAAPFGSIDETVAVSYTHLTLPTICSV